MNHELTDSSHGCKALRISVSWPEVSADYDDVFAAYCKVPVPGFRPGKAPREAVERRFRSELRDDFVARCAKRLVREALRERDLRAAGPVSLVAIQFEPRREFAFTAEFVPVPRLVLPEYSAAPLTGRTQSERRDELSAWLLVHTEWEAPEPLIRRECDLEESAEPGSVAWRKTAERVKLMQILDQIADAEGIEVDERDVGERIEAVSAEQGLKPEELSRQLGKDGVSRLLSLLRCEQTLAYLLEANSVSGSGAREWSGESPERR